jgi:hypothetical protein
MMLGQHYTRQLSAYAHGELAPGETARVAAHLDGCRRCRAEYEEVKLGIRLAETLPAASAPAGLWEELEARLDRQAAAGRLRTKAVALERPSAFGRRALAWAAFAVVVLFAGAAWFYLWPARPAWDVARLEGTPVIESGAIGERGRLAVGDLLETDSRSRARVEVANIGEVDLDPNTRVRLVETRLTEHRLELERGKLHARIWAPPRLFFVNTPSAVAADLGCAYTLEVDDAGGGLLRVTSGWVALEDGKRESLVPAGAACVTRPGAGPGTPFFADAPEELTDALARFDFDGGGPEALDAVLRAARERDTLTLWHLIPRVAEAERARVYERLAAVAPPPAGVTREDVLRLDRDALDTWKGQLEGRWLTEDFPAVRKAWRKLWK